MSKFGNGVTSEHVVLLDATGQPRGTAPKQAVHGTDTPLHLGFSCHLVDRQGRVLLTRRAAAKPTWPGTWSNGCCGHPGPGETLRAAVTRRLREELGLTARSMGLAISDFTYRAVMDNGLVEHEVCPVVVAEVDSEPTLNPTEVDDASWVDWTTLCDRAHQQPETLSPWSVGQIAQLRRLGPSPRTWLHHGEHVGRHALDAPFGGALPNVTSRTACDALAPIRGPVEAVLGRFLSTRTTELNEVDPALAVVTREITDLVAAGGKRLRPAFVYWGHRATGADHEPAVAELAAAVEMVHTFALLHDDVMDRALTRRGRAVASRGFALAHGAERLAGDGEWFGTSAAILAGDLAFVWADQLLEAAALDHVTMTRVRGVFTTLRVEVMAGQYLDLRLDGATCVDPDAARQVAVLKSGRYTVTRPLQLGVAAAGVGCPDSRLDRALASYGDAIGLAFQLRDDVLGLFGDPSTTGKSNADDLRAGKRTLLMLRAMALATPANGAFLARSLGNRDLDDEDAARCRDIVQRSGALASVETLLRHQHEAALEALTEVPEPARGALVGLASMAAERDH
jgi:isopentenyl-diphosphate delta-isomerase type 1